MGVSITKRGSRASVALTPAGLGALILIVPGLILGAVAREPALLAVVFGAVLLILVNLVWSWWVLRTVTVSAGHQGVGTVGEWQPILISVKGLRGSDVELRVHPESNRRWDAIVVPGEGNAGLQPMVRGAFTSVDGQLRTSFPLGLIWQHQRCVIEFARPLHVAPAHSPTSISIPPFERAVPYGIPNEGFSGLRPYMVGDLRRDIHWRSVARTGNLMVKDRIRTGENKRVHIVIEGTNDSDKTLGECRTVAEAFLAYGHVVKLTSVDYSPESRDLRVVSELVTSSDEVAQRLARVGKTRVFHPLTNPEEIVLVVGRDGLRWDGSGV